MQAQPVQGMSISDIMKIAQMAKANQQQPTGDVPSPVEMTYTRESGSPVANGMNVPVPPKKPDMNQTGGLWETIKGYFGG